MIKRSIQKEDIAHVNIFVPNRGAHKCIQHIFIDIKGEINNNTVIVGDFKPLLTSMDRSSR